MTLDTLHIKKIKEFKRENDKHKTLKTLKNQKEKLMKNNSPSDAMEIMELNEKIEKIQKNLDENKDDTKLKSYYVEAGDVLFSYYDSFENIKKSNTIDNTSRPKSILSFFGENTENPKNKLEEDETRADLQNKYLELDCNTGNLNNLNNLKNITSSKRKVAQLGQAFECCDVCESELILVPTEGIAECSCCGNMQEIVDDGSKTSFKDTPKETAYYSYKRTNHFNEWLAQFQGKETTTIPRTILIKIWTEIKKERMNIDDLSKSKMRSILKKLKLSKYYEHVPYIICLLNGNKAPYMTRRTEELLRLMFQKIQSPFVEFCPKERKNFLSYSYVLHKFVEIMGMHHLKPLFPLLKSREKLFAADLIWKKICIKLGWKFYKSI